MPVKPWIEKNIKNLNLLISMACQPLSRLAAGLSNTEISGFNTSMPNSLSIYTKVNPS